MLYKQEKYLSRYSSENDIISLSFLSYESHFSKYLNYTFAKDAVFIFPCQYIFFFFDKTENEPLQFTSHELIIFKRQLQNIASSQFPLKNNELQSLRTLVTKVYTSENRDKYEFAWNHSMISFIIDKLIMLYVKCLKFY